MVKQENVEESVGCGTVHGLKVKEEPDVGIDEKGLEVEQKKVVDGYESKGSVDKCYLSFDGEEIVNGLKVKEEPDMGIEEKGLKVEEKKVLDDYQSKGSVGKWDLSFDEWLKFPENNPEIDTQKPKEEKKLEIMKVKEEQQDVLCVEPLSARPLSKQEYNSLKNSNVANGAKQEYNRLKSSSNVAICVNMEKMGIKKNMLSTIVIEDGDFPEDLDWLLVGRTIVTGLSTTKGRKLENNEIVHFAFPQQGNSKCSSQWGGSRAAVAAASSIVRFSTKRFGEVNLNSIILLSSLF